jgi:hypothetical protein
MLSKRVKSRIRQNKNRRGHRHGISAFVVEVRTHEEFVEFYGSSETFKLSNSWVNAPRVNRDVKPWAQRVRSR